MTVVSCCWKGKLEGDHPREVMEIEGAKPGTFLWSGATLNIRCKAEDESHGDLIARLDALSSMRSRLMIEVRLDDANKLTFWGDELPAMGPPFSTRNPRTVKPFDVTLSGPPTKIDLLHAEVAVFVRTPPEFDVFVDFGLHGKYESGD